MFRSDSVFSRFMNMLFDILFTGILWLVFSIPVITAGAATTAAYYTMAKCVRHKTGYIGKEFWGAFRRNLKQSLPLTILFLAIAAILALDIQYVWVNDSAKNSALFIILVFLAFLAAGLLVYIWPLLSRFDKKTLELFKIAAVLLFKYLPVTIGVLAIVIVACIGAYLMPWAVFVIPGVYLYALSYPMERILRKLMPAVEEDSEEAQKWYYQ
ncbi:MAG: YesL family protein [Roseburia sp.]